MTAISRLIAAERITRTVKGRQRPLVTSITQDIAISAENKLDDIDAKLGLIYQNRVFILI